MCSWLLYKIVDIIRQHTHAAIIVTGIITNTLVLISVISAFPWIRKLVSISLGSWRNVWLTSISTHHNVFEKHHRFIGWLGLAVSFLFFN